MESTEIGTMEIGVVVSEIDKALKANKQGPRNARELVRLTPNVGQLTEIISNLTPHLTIHGEGVNSATDNRTPPGKGHESAYPVQDIIDYVNSDQYLP